MYCLASHCLTAAKSLQAAERYIRLAQQGMPNFSEYDKIFMFVASCIFHSIFMRDDFTDAVEGNARYILCVTSAVLRRLTFEISEASHCKCDITLIEISGILVEEVKYEGMSGISIYTSFQLTNT
jgi:hypothetical protein